MLYRFGKIFQYLYLSLLASLDLISSLSSGPPYLYVEFCLSGFQQPLIYKDLSSIFVQIVEKNMGADCCSSGSQELHVLAVDDSHVDRKVIERLLKISSCKVTIVESGSKALQYLGLDGEKNSVGFDGLKVNLIMTDYSMPGMTGYELLKKIKGSSSLSKIPVVIMSSENIIARIDRCMDEGAEEFLQKPVKLSDVKRLKDFILTNNKDGEDLCSRKRRRQDLAIEQLKHPKIA